MSRGSVQGAAKLFGWKNPTTLESPLFKSFPSEYVKFYKEWRSQPKPVHYIPKEGRYERNEQTGRVTPVQNVPIKITFPPEADKGIWGGEGVIRGFQKRHPQKRRVTHFWMPFLKQTVVHSVILNKNLSVTVTDRTLKLIHEHCGFDNYILETKACDLQSMLALKLKRNILKEIQAGCPALADDPAKQKEVLEKYKPFGDSYTPLELEWYGLSVYEASEKVKEEQKAAKLAAIKPLKHEYRERFLERLKQSGIDQVEQIEVDTSKTDSRRIELWSKLVSSFKKKD